MNFIRHHRELEVEDGNNGEAYTVSMTDGTGLPVELTNFPVLGEFAETEQSLVNSNISNLAPILLSIQTATATAGTTINPDPLPNPGLPGRPPVICDISTQNCIVHYSTQNVRYYITDHLGTVRRVYDQNAVLISTHDYEPFGVEIPPEDACENSHRFTGHERDTETGLDYMHFRSYGARWGRFLSFDPTQRSAFPNMPLSWNKYAYCVNNPENLTDPNGQSWIGKVIGKVVKLGFRKGMKVVRKIRSAKDLRRLAKEGEDLLVRGKKNARKLAKAGGNGKEPIHHKAHGKKKDGFKNHFHPSGGGGGHIFYETLISTAAGLTVSHYAEGSGTVLKTAAAALDLVNPLSLPQDVIDITEEVTDPELWVPFEDTTSTAPEASKPEEESPPPDGSEVKRPEDSPVP